jgi:hypothetical protein
VDQKFERIFLIRIKSRRLDDEILNLFVVCAFERERFQRLHVDLRQERVVHVRERFKAGMLLRRNRTFIGWEVVVFPDFIRCGNGHPREE